MTCCRWFRQAGLVLTAAIALVFATGIGFGERPADVGSRATLEEIRHWNRVGRSGDAERAARANLKEAERAFGSESVEAAEILDELAVALRRGGKSAEPEALEVCQRAVRIKKQVVGDKDPRYATSLYNLGLLYLVRKEFKQALSVLKETFEIRKMALNRNHPDVAKSLLSLGSVQHDLGNYAEGLALTEQAVEIEEIALGKANPERAYGLNALAVAHYSTGDFSGAIPLFEEAIDLWERSKTPNQQVIALCYHNLGAVCDEMGDHERAIGLLERALRLREEQFGVSHPLVAGTLSVLADALQAKGDLSRGKACYKRAVQIVETAAPPDPDLGWYRSKLGWLYLEEGDYARAWDTLVRALNELEAAHGPDHPDLWMSLRGLAMAAWNLGETEAARPYYERTLTLVRKTSGLNHPDFGRTLAEYSAFLLATGDSLGALDRALVAAEVNREHLRLTARGIAERQALQYASKMGTGLDVAFDALSGTLGSRSGDFVRSGWNALIRSRALVLDEVAERARLVGSAGDVLDVAKRLETARNRLANLMVRAPSGESPERDRELIAQARKDVERAETELAARSRSFRTMHDRAALGWDQVVSALPPGSALVSYAGYREGRRRSILAFVLGTDRTPRAVALGSADEIDRLILHWRSLAGKPPGGGSRGVARAEAECRTAGDAIRVRVWDPFSNLLGGSRMVFIVPDGSLNLLNVAALPKLDSGYLIESPYVMHYLSTERDIVSAGGRPVKGIGLLAVGGASFDRQEVQPSGESAPPLASVEPPTRASPAATYREALADCERFRSLRFEPLPETVREVDEISEFWGRADESVVLEGEYAGERAVKERIAGRRVAHFATHGFFLDRNCGRPDEAGRAGERGIGGITSERIPPAPLKTALSPFLLSGLALAGANLRASVGPGEEDGILTAEEIVSLDLSGLDWVVLSACDTGLGDVRSGEGVLGLRRAFEVAGAGTLIMSLWAVEDRSTRDWMAVLYEGRFRSNLETAEAVREANLSALRSLRDQGRATHPFYWAAFVAVGGWR